MKFVDNDPNRSTGYDINSDHEKVNSGKGSEEGNRYRTMSNIIKSAKCGICHDKNRAGLGQCTASMCGATGCNRIYCEQCDGRLACNY